MAKRSKRSELGAMNAAQSGSLGEAERGPSIELDPLALNVRSAFVALYLPHLPCLAEQRDP